MLSALVARRPRPARGRARHREDGARPLDRADDRGRDASPASSARRTCSRPTSPGSRSTTRRRREFEFRPGPVFANIVLVDEINRAMPKTQSALLEAMAERQVTVDGVTHAAARAVPRDRDREPDRAGGDVPAARGAARPLRAARRARLSGSSDEEVAIVVGAAPRASARRARPAVSADDAARAAARGRGRLRRRPAPALDRRARARDARRRTESPSARRCAAASTLERTARAWALLHGRAHVVPEDVERLFLPVLGHRLLLTTSFLAETRALGRDAERARRRSAPRCLGARAAAGPRAGTS